MSVFQLQEGSLHSLKTFGLPEMERIHDLGGGVDVLMHCPNAWQRRLGYVPNHRVIGTTRAAGFEIL
jgi:hypothetical protein